MRIKAEATIEDLYQVEGKAEIVNGEIILMPPSGFMPNRASGAISMSLHQYGRRFTSGYALTELAAFHVQLSHRKSFCPDASFYIGEPTGMEFLEGAPAFAAEVRSENDYGPQAERAMAHERADYFEAGTLVVWDVDLLSEDVVRVYRASDLAHPTIYRRGAVAEAEPAVPDWTMPVDELFE